MSKMSFLAKATVLAILIAMLFASFPTTSVVAKGNKEGLEQKWSQLVDNYNRQTTNHVSAHHWVDRWLLNNQKLSASKREEVQRHLDICNTALMSAGSIVAKHAGFDAKGKLIDRAAAIKSIKDLAYYLRQHAGSIKNLSEHINQ